MKRRVNVKSESSRAGKYVDSSRYCLYYFNVLSGSTYLPTSQRVSKFKRRYPPFTYLRRDMNISKHELQRSRQLQKNATLCKMRTYVPQHNTPLRIRIGNSTILNFQGFFFVKGFDSYPSLLPSRPPPFKYIYLSVSSSILIPFISFLRAAS